VIVNSEENVEQSACYLGLPFFICDERRLEGHVVDLSYSLQCFFTLSADVAESELAILTKVVHGLNDMLCNILPSISPEISPFRTVQVRVEVQHATFTIWIDCACVFEVASTM